jgi:hypothetical protein
MVDRVIQMLKSTNIDDLIDELAELFPPDAPLDTINARLHSLIDDTKTSPEKKMVIVMSMFMGLSSLDCIRAIREAEERASTIIKIIEGALVHLDKCEHLAYSLMRALDKTEDNLMIVEPADICALFADYTREPADFDSKDGIVWEVYCFYDLAAIIVPIEMPSIAPYIVKRILDDLAERYPDNIKRRVAQAQ